MDKIRMYERKEYENGTFKDIWIGMEEFLPSMYFEEDDEKAFMEKLRKQGFVQRYELNMKSR